MLLNNEWVKEIKEEIKESGNEYEHTTVHYQWDTAKAVLKGNL